MIYYEARFLKSIFEGQDGAWPEVKALSTQVQKRVDGSTHGFTKPEKSQDQMRGTVEGDEDINIKEFERIKSDHEALLRTIKSVKNKVGV